MTLRTVPRTFHGHIITLEKPICVSRSARCTHSRAFIRKDSLIFYWPDSRYNKYSSLGKTRWSHCRRDVRRGPAAVP